MVLRGGSGDQLRAVIAAAVRLYREGLAALLAGHHSMSIAGEASNVVEAEALVRDTSPDIVLVDIAMGGALDFIRGIGASAPSTRSVVFALDEDIASIMSCAEAGAAGYVTVNGSIDELVDTIRRASAGELLCTPRVAAELFKRVGQRARERADADTLPAALTSREREVLGQLKQGLSNKSIAAVLHISEATVKNHVHHLLEKLGVDSRHQAAVGSLSAPDRRRAAGALDGPG